MLKTVIVSVLMLFSIFWGLFPASENSHITKLQIFLVMRNTLQYLHIDWLYILYSIGIFITIESINYMWK